MSVPVPATAIVRYEPALSKAELTALAGFLAAYRGYTRDAYALDLRQFTAWCLQRGRHLFDVRRLDIECFARDLEDAGKARATVARRLCTIIGFYRYAEEEGAIERSPGVHIRRPRVDYESNVSVSTATRSAPLWWPPVCPRHGITRWYRRWHSTDCASPRWSEPTSTHSA
jgi:Phage integrase, N-terminal SAM-like domain